MNFLAHIYLSNDDEGVKIGNFIADGIKGKTYEKYPKAIQKGILLHRAIDSYTDQHPIFRQSTKRLHENHGHYSGVVVDMFYDHFLAKNWKQYSEIPLEDYVEDFYELLETNYVILPLRIQRMMPYLISQNWLVNYRTKAGMATILSQMNKRAKGRANLDMAILDLDAHYDAFEAEFTSFFKEIIAYAHQKLNELSL